MHPLSILFSSLVIAGRYIISPGAQVEDSISQFNVKVLNAKFRLMSSPKFIALAISNKLPDAIPIEVCPREAPQTKINPSVKTTATRGFAGIDVAIISPYFIEFYENYDTYLYKSIGTPEKWPQLWRFARVVRNSLSHDGTIDFRRKEPRVTWHGVSYTYDDNGKKIIGDDCELDSGDLLVLMLAMSDELDTQGCPT